MFGTVDFFIHNKMLHFDPCSSSSG